MSFEIRRNRRGTALAAFALLPLGLSLLSGGCGEDSSGTPGESTGGKAGSTGGAAPSSGGQAAAGRGSGGTSPSGGAATGGAVSTKGGSAGTAGVAGAPMSDAGEGGGGEGGSAGSSAGSGGDPGSAGAGAAGAAGASGGAGEEPWTGCPAAEDYAGEDDWPHALEVMDGATYCATFNEARTIEQELAAKAQLRVAPGSYRLPGADAAGIALPVCVKFGEDGTPVGVVPDATSYATTEFDGNVTHRYTIDETLPDPDRLLSLDLAVEAPSAAVPEFVIDGSAPDLEDPSVPNFLATLCPSLEPSCIPDRAFTACSNAGWTLNQHDVVLDAGTVRFELQIGTSFASTEPGAFVRASGTYQGVAFDQENYYRLIYSPTHHHFERHFAVLFDAPIDGACGVEVAGLEPFEQNSTPDEAYAVDCELGRLETLSVMSHVLTQIPP